MTPHDLILGTAGHIDHGKTSLVQALTGINTDRLPEEKARGITIDIGFAHLELGPYRIGIVDVPGHERFIKNMLAGATGIDLALLIVAADDSIMPQTREHLEILILLRVPVGVIALTKSDLVDATTREVVELEIRELVFGTFLQDALIIATSTTTGAGIPELKAALETACSQSIRYRHSSANEPFRLPIDRSFTLAGHGTIVTGSVLSGSVRIGDELEWLKGDGTSELVRVRSLNNHGQAVEEIHRGQRGGVNLAGIDHEFVHRGQELATPGFLKPTKLITVQLNALAQNPKGIKHRLPVRLHIGTAEVMAIVSILDADVIEPECGSYVQLFLEDPVASVWGQPFIVRDSSAEHTLGGGMVVQPNPTKIRRFDDDTLLFLEQLETRPAPERIVAATWLEGFSGITREELPRKAGVPADQVTTLLSQQLDDNELVEYQLPPSRSVLFHRERVLELANRILKTLSKLHAEFPLVTRHDRSKVLAQLDYIGDMPLLHVITDEMLEYKDLVGDARRIARADFKPKLTANQMKLKEKIVEEHRVAGFQPPEPSSFANATTANATAIKDIFEVACAEGDLVRIAPDLYLHSETEQELRTLVIQRLHDSPGATMAELRDLMNTTRKFAVPICEYLDRIGLTRRLGDLRALAKTEPLC